MSNLKLQEEALHHVQFKITRRECVTTEKWSKIQGTE